MTPPAGSGVEHLPPGAKPAAESFSPPPAKPPSGVPDVRPPDDIPRYPGLKALGEATSGRDSPETVTTTQAFSADAPVETVVNWYESTLGEGWRRTAVPGIGSRAATTSFDRDLGDGNAMTITIAAADDTVRVTISRTRPADGG
jgi:hypothetical protein